MQFYSCRFRVHFVDPSCWGDSVKGRAPYPVFFWACLGPGIQPGPNPPTSPRDHQHPESPRNDRPTFPRRRSKLTHPPRQASTSRLSPVWNPTCRRPHTPCLRRDRRAGSGLADSGTTTDGKRWGRPTATATAWVVFETLTTKAVFVVFRFAMAPSSGIKGRNFTSRWTGRDSGRRLVIMRPEPLFHPRHKRTVRARPKPEGGKIPRAGWVRSRAEHQNTSSKRPDVRVAPTASALTGRARASSTLPLVGAPGTAGSLRRGRPSNCGLWRFITSTRKKRS